MRNIRRSAQRCGGRPQLVQGALEQAEAGTSWHAVADEGDKVRDIAAVIGQRLGLPPDRPQAKTGLAASLGSE
jgi:hypothetical protein